MCVDVNPWKSTYYVKSSNSGPTPRTIDVRPTMATCFPRSLAWAKGMENWVPLLTTMLEAGSGHGSCSGAGNQADGGASDPQGRSRGRARSRRLSFPTWAPSFTANLSEDQA